MEEKPHHWWRGRLRDVPSFDDHDTKPTNLLVCAQKIVRIAVRMRMSMTSMLVPMVVAMVVVMVDMVVVMVVGLLLMMVMVMRIAR